MLWYQTGPYEAYYYSGRYQDVIHLATTTLNAMSEPVLEEGYYWRALAREALGDKEAATSDLQATLKYHPGFGTGACRVSALGNGAMSPATRIYPGQSARQQTVGFLQRQCARRLRISKTAQRLASCQPLLSGGCRCRESA